MLDQKGLFSFFVFVGSELYGNVPNRKIRLTLELVYGTSRAVEVGHYS